MKDLQHVLYEESGGFGFLYLNRPMVHNAMDTIMISEIINVITTIISEGQIRALVIRGKGKSFSSGADINYMNSLMNATRRENLEDAGFFTALYDCIYNCPIPVISVAHGNVFGGANGLIAASDISLCSENTVFRFSEIKIGLIPATISPYVIQRIGEFRFAELVFTGKIFKGETAFQIGLVNHCVKEDELENALHNILDDIKSSGPEALMKAKLLIRSVSGKEIDSEIRRLTSKVLADVRVSAEAREGMLAFLEKRNPSWNKQV